MAIRQKPRVIQLPVTSKCNSKCVTCNVWKNGNHTDIDPDVLRESLAHPYFSEIRSVGINGGEITLHRRFEEVVRAICVLKKLKNVTVISNGLLTERLLERMEMAHRIFRQHHVDVVLTLSIDSVGSTHDLVRGIDGAFKKTKESILRIKEDMAKYCEVLGIGCTISKYNVYELYKVEQLACELELPVEFHLAVPNKRIGTFSDAGRYSVLDVEHARLSAMEFFQKRMSREKNLGRKISVFMQYKYLEQHGKGRLATCIFKYRDITIDENLDMYLCATASDSLGNLVTDGIDKVIDKSNMKRVERQVSGHCDTCIHYCWQPTLRALWLVVKMKIGNKFSAKRFKMEASW